MMSAARPTRFDARSRGTMTEFKQLFPWSLEPVRPHVNRQAAQERAAVYRDCFRFVRAKRQAEFCPPWVLGQELGWHILSPIDATLTPLPQTEISATESAPVGLHPPAAPAR
jgi:hypothetical protein